MNTIIRAFARNRVFANLVMITVMTAGILSAFLMVREDMPDLQLDTIVITVSYPGADPEEVEEGISRKVEEAIDGLEGVDEYTSTSAEGISSTVIDVVDGYDADQLLDRVRNEIDSITTFPDDSENPSIFRPQIQKAVISLALLSEMPEARLKEWADTVKKEIHRLPGVSQVNLSGTRSYEISVEITQADLMKYDLSINEVAQIIADNSLNQSGGTLKTSGQEIRLRTLGRKYTGSELGRIKIIGGADGQTLYLDDIAQIRDEFTENHLAIKANGQPAVLLNVLAADEDTITIADTVRGYQEKVKATLPEDSDIIVLSDNTESTRSNLDTLLSNAVMGLVLVFILLWLFMDTKISFWAGMGIPISLLGGLAIVHFAGITLNKITLFGLIMVLGIVADDAIVVGESIFFHRKNGASALDAVVKGVSEVGMPVLAAILTTIVAFFPLYHIKGVMGKFIVALPTAVIACLSVSLIECMVMLPAHLNDIAAAGETPVSRFRVIAWIERFHRFTVNSMEWAAQKVYLPVLTLCVRHRYLFVCLCCAVLFLCAGLVLGGTIKFNVFPRQASGIVVATVEFPEGTPFATTQAAVERLEDAALRAGALLETGELSGTGQSLVTNILTTVGQGAGEKMGGIKSASPNVGGVRVSLLDAEISGIHSDDFIHAWEEATGHISGVQSLDFSASRSGPPGAPIEIALQGEQLSDINAAADRIMARLNTIKGVSQVFSDNAPGKNELKLRLKKEAQYLGLDMSDLSRQIFGAYYGAEAVTIQRGNDEVEVRVRLTSDERQTMESLTDYRVKAKENTWVPLSAVADITYGPGYSTITRKDGLRQVKVSAKVNLSQIVAGEVIAELEQGLFKELKRDYPDIRIILEGDAKRSAESFSSLYVWIPISIMGMFAIIATMFRSYVQPLLILFTIPFGLVGAVIGHFIMGHMLSLLSVFGMVALTGVVVNDAIVLIERINMNLEEGMHFFDALFQGGVRRFRAVMLTSISTIGGLLPLLLETSQHARQLIPMGISLAFGVAFATVLTLVMLPCIYTIVNDFRCGLAWICGRKIIGRHILEPAWARQLATIASVIIIVIALPGPGAGIFAGQDTDCLPDFSSPLTSSTVSVGPAEVSVDPAEVSVGPAEVSVDPAEVSVDPADSLTLARAKKIALENHPSMDSAMERVRQAQEVVTQARAAYLPTLSASAGWDYMEDTQGGSQAVDEIQYTQRLSVTQVLFNGFYRKYSLESAKNRESMSRDDLSESRRLLSWAVAQAFLNLQLALENVKTAASDMTFNQRLESEAIAKQAAGAGSLSDVLNFRTKVNAAKASVLSAQQDRLEASYALAALMGYKDACLPEEMAIASLSNRVGLPDQIQTDGFGPDVDQIEQIQVEQILADRPDLNKAALSVKNVENDIQMVKAAYFPTISLTGSYGTSSGNQWFDTDNMGASVGVSVTFEIFSGGTRQSRLRQSMAEKRELEKDLEEARMTARSNIRTAAGNIEMTSRQLALQTENTELVRTTRDLVEKEYRAGQESLVRLNEAQNELISSLGELSRAKVSLVLALEEFDYYIGENFE